jgi:hypothetical protein
MRSGWGRSFYTAAPASRLDMLNPPSTSVSLPTAAAYTFAVSGLVSSVVDALDAVRLELYDGTRWVPAGVLRYSASFLSLAGNTRIVNQSHSSVARVVFTVTRFTVIRRVVTVDAGDVYVIPDVGFITTTRSVLPGYGGIHVYDGTTWQYAEQLFLWHSKGSNVRCSNADNTNPITLVYLVGVLG